MGLKPHVHSVYQSCCLALLQDCFQLIKKKTSENFLCFNKLFYSMTSNPEDTKEHFWKEGKENRHKFLFSEGGWDLSLINNHWFSYKLKYM